MAPKLRYYGKKRGNRRTGSKKLGSAGEALFFAVFLLLGLGGLVVLFAWVVIPEWRVNHQFVEAPCTVLETTVGEDVREDGTLYRPEVRIKYEVDGQTYVVSTYDIATVRDFSSSYSRGRAEKQRLLEPFAVDPQRPGQHRCWYDPDDPMVAVLVLGYTWWLWLLFVVPVSFIVIGGGGFLYAALHWGTSAERRAAMAQRVQEQDLFGGNGSGQREFPNIPGGSDIINSPGTTLRFRLPIARSPGWALLGVLIVCLVWNGIVSVFVAIALRGHLDGQPDWFLTLFIIPFVLAGMGLIVLFLRQLLVTTGIGPTRVEISGHPLQPGQQCRLLVSQSGRLSLHALEVLLVCEEEATYRQGTNTRTETCEIHRQSIFRREGFEVRRGLPFQTECDLKVPAGAMHSFKADHNEVHWKVIVQGNVAGWPDYRREFPVIVHPGNGRPAP